VLEYDDFFPTLRTWAASVAGARAQQSEAAGQEPPEKKQKADSAAEGAKEQAKAADGTSQEKIVKTDKVIIGDQVSWAVADVLGEDNVEVRRSMICDAKAIKNAVSAASARFPAWRMSRRNESFGVEGV
jgi:Xaa-Pro aminopeptidase